MAGTVDGSDVHVTRGIPMVNAERSPTWFSFDPAEQLRVWRDVDDADEEVVVIYHSHTMTAPEPSRTDLQFAEGTGEALWLLVSTRSEVDEVQAWRIVEGAAVLEEIVLRHG
jgi:proteasome lid subunit RPN8/RPN11